MTDIIEILLLIISVLRTFIIAHFIMSWLISFQVLNPRQPQVGQIWYGLNQLLEPIQAIIAITKIISGQGALINNFSNHTRK